MLSLLNGGCLLTMVVNAGSRTNQWCSDRTSYWSNSLAVNPDGRWLSVAATDPALLHAQLSLVVQHQALSRGTSFPELYYYHRGMAIGIVTSRLAHPVEAIRDATIGAVALLSNSDVSGISSHVNRRFLSEACGECLDCDLIKVHLQNYFDVPADVRVQDSHIQGLFSLVQLRGGLQMLSTNEPVKRVVTWADLVHAASNDTVPRLGMSKCNAGYDLMELFPDPTSAGCLVRTIYPEEPPVPGPLKEGFETIRMLSMAQSSPDTVDLKSTVNRRILANVLYKIEYLLLDPGLLALEASNVQEGSRHSNYSDVWTPLFSATTDSNYSDVWTPLFSATTAGALIFTYSCLRNIAIPSRPYENLVRRLRHNLQLVFDEERTSSGSAEQGWTSREPNGHSPSGASAHPSLLLWLLMHGFKATARTPRKDVRAWFVRRGAEMCKTLEIDSVEGLDAAIKQVVVSRLQCVPVIHAYWKAMGDATELGEEFW